MPEVLETSAAAAVDSATTPVATPEVPAFDAADQKTWSEGQRETWNRTGEQPTKADSAPAKKEKEKTAAPDSAPDKDRKSADSASDSAPDKDTQKPHQKTKEDTERRIQELLEDKKNLQRQLEASLRGKTPETRDSKQESPPAAEVYKPLDEKAYFKDNPKASYEDFVRAAAKHEAKWEVRQEMAAERTRLANEAAQKELSSRVEEAKKRYPDFDERIQPAVKAITDDPGIPFAVKAIINDSPAFVDLIYVLGEPAALKDLIHTAKTNPAAAIRKIVLTEQLVQAELAKGSTKAEGADGRDKAGDGPKRDESGKFVASEDKEKDKASETKPRAPKPPSEVGGRGTVSIGEEEAAIKANDFTAMDRAMTRRYAAQLKQG